jgi:hypothetical protein
VSYYGHRDLEDGRHLCVVGLTFGRARLLISSDDRHLTYDDAY